MHRGKPEILITQEPSVSEYFRKRIEKALENQRVETDHVVKIYLSNLLTDFMRTDVLFGRTDEDLAGKPLALIYAEALTSITGVQIRLLKYLGDFTMFFSGFFSDSLQRKIIDVDYLITLGGIAYGKLHHRYHLQQEDRVLSDLFSDLSGRFTVYVDILSEISEESQLHDHRDVLRLYEKWLKTRSERTAAQLRKQGIQLDEAMPPKYLH
jgi:hypothetical protein